LKADGAASPSQPSAVEVPAAAEATTATTVRLVAGQATATGVVSDARLEADLTTLTSGQDGVLGIQAVTAALALRGVQAQTRGHADTVVLTLPRDWQPASPAWAEPVADVLALPWLHQVSLGSVVDTSPASEVHLSAGTKPGRGPSSKQVSALVAALDRIDAFAEVTADPPAFRIEHAPRLLPALAFNLIPPEARNQRAATAIGQVDSLVNGLSVVKGSGVNLISEAGELPITVRNDTASAVAITVGLTASRPSLLTEDTVAVSLDPGDQVITHLPVQAVANGAVDVTVHLRNSLGREVGPTSTFRITVHAEWESIGTAIFAGLIGLLFVSGLVRSIRRRSRERAARARAAQSGLAPGRRIRTRAEATTSASADQA
jgi:hypothetical protein